MDGVVFINKPAGITSFGVVKKIRPLVGGSKVGHGGTLDPMATGLLPIMIGKGTKLMETFLQLDKTYCFSMLFGSETDTEDVFGREIKKVPFDEVSIERLESVLLQLSGEIDQCPPMYSAVRYKGKRLYKLARKGITVPRKKRKVKIHEIHVLRFDLPCLDLRVRCSRGTYVRTLCADIGVRLGSAACMRSLVRERIGACSLADAISLEEITKGGRQALCRSLISIDECRRLN